MASSTRLVMLIKNIHIYFMKSLYPQQGYKNEFHLLSKQPKTMLTVVNYNLKMVCVLHKV